MLNMYGSPYEAPRTEEFKSRDARWREHKLADVNSAEIIAIGLARRTWFSNRLDEGNQVVTFAVKVRHPAAFAKILTAIKNHRAGVFVLT